MTLVEVEVPPCILEVTIDSLSSWHAFSFNPEEPIFPKTISFLDYIATRCSCYLRTCITISLATRWGLTNYYLGWHFIVFIEVQSKIYLIHFKICYVYTFLDILSHSIYKMIIGNLYNEDFDLFLCCHINTYHISSRCLMGNQKCRINIINHFHFESIYNLRTFSLITTCLKG